MVIHSENGIGSAVGLSHSAHPRGKYDIASIFKFPKWEKKNKIEKETHEVPCHQR